EGGRERVPQLAQREEFVEAAVELAGGTLPVPLGGCAGGPFPAPRPRETERRGAEQHGAGHQHPRDGAAQWSSPSPSPVRTVRCSSGGAFGLTRMDLAGTPTLRW